MVVVVIVLVVELVLVSSNKVVAEMVFVCSLVRQSPIGAALNR